MSSTIFAIVPTDVLTDHRLSPIDRVLYAVLCGHANQSAEAWPSIPTLAAEVGTSDRTIQRSLVTLCKYGHVVRSDRLKEDGSHTSNLYTIPWLAGRQGVVTEEPPRGDGSYTTRGDAGDTQTDSYEQTIEQPPIVPPGGDVREVFDYWKERTGRNGNTILDDKRKRAIQRGLKWLGVDGCRQAIVGMCNSPFHQGVNDRGQKYDDITLVFRDAKHAEEFHETGSIYYEREGTLC